MISPHNSKKIIIGLYPMMRYYDKKIKEDLDCNNLINQVISNATTG